MPDTPPPNPPNPDLARYHRQMTLPAIAEAGQRRLLASHAMIVGCGALGCVVADQLARAGVGTLTIIDRDVVELSNLQRQTLFDEEDARQGAPKAEAARACLAQINSQVRINAHAADLTPANAEHLAGLPSRSDNLPPTALIIDATDNFQTRLLLNDLAVKHAIPFIYAGVAGTRATTMTIMPGSEWGGAPCLRCIVEDAPAPASLETCDTAGVLAPAVAMIASIQSTEALKILTGNTDSLRTTLLELDPWTSVYHEINLAQAKRADCPCCARRWFDFLEGGACPATTNLCGRNAVQITPENQHHLDLDALALRLAPHGIFESSPFALRGILTNEQGDSGDQLHLTVFKDGRAIVRGTTRPDRARALCARYLG
ncbi:MAG: ThiF family adenylyltransferase [Phycisphaerales bacterium]|nr:ThiF family adenylyltransferase [Phycisphaerales bacterium]